MFFEVKQIKDYVYLVALKKIKKSEVVTWRFLKIRIQDQDTEVEADFLTIVRLQRRMFEPLQL